MADEELVAKVKADPKPRKAKTSDEMLSALNKAGEKPEVGSIDPDALQRLPGASRGVRVNVAQRTLKMGKPVCPDARQEYDRDSNGNIVPVERPGRQNHQLAARDVGPAWIEDCERDGHDPYFRTVKWYTPEDEFEELGDGRRRKIGEILIPNSVRIPNLAQVAINKRINNGEGAVRAIRIKGFKRLKDIGFEEVCQFRNCIKPVYPQFTSRSYGAFCSRQHLLLVTADAEDVLLHQPEAYINGEEYVKVQRARQKQLMEVSLLAQGDAEGIS